MNKSQALLSLLLLSSFAVAVPALAVPMDNFIVVDKATATTFTFSLAASPAPPSQVTANYFDISGVSMLENGVAKTGTIFFNLLSNSGGIDIGGGSYFLDDIGVQLFSGTTAAPTFLTGSFKLHNSSAPTNQDKIATVSITSATAATPEPQSLVLLGTGIIGMAGAIRRKLSL